MDEADIQEWEYPEPDPDDDETFDLVACPHCGSKIFEDSEQCPHCQHYVLTSVGVAAARGGLGWVGVLLIIGVLILVAMGTLLGR